MNSHTVAKSRLFTNNARQITLADRLEASPRFFLFLFSIAYFVGICCMNHRRAFWIDELVLSELADLPSISQIWPLIEKGIELNPPLPFWLTWILHHVVGKGEIITRLPAAIGFWVMCLCLYHFVRRRSDVLHGFIALLLPIFTYSIGEATWARGYGIMLGFTGLAVLSWQLARDGVRRPYALAGLALSLAGAVSCHYYAVYLAGALALGEIERVRAGGKSDFPVWGALAAGLSPLILYLPLLRSAARGLENFWVAPLPQFLYEAYVDLLGPITMVLFLLLGFILRHRSGEADEPRWTPATLKPEELVVAMVLTAMPLLVFIGGMVSSLASYPRYVQPVVMGFTILTVLFAYRVGGNDRQFRLQAISLLVWVCFTPWLLWQIGVASFSGKLGDNYLYAIDLKVEPQLPLVVDNEVDFAGLFHYATPLTRERLFMLSDRKGAVEFLGSDTGLRTLDLLQTVHDTHVVDYSRFVREHREFLIARTRVGSWITQKLMKDGATVELVRFDKGKGTFTPETLLFRVTLNDSFALVKSDPKGTARGLPF